MTIIVESIEDRFSEYVESRLQEWVEWFFEDSSGLGYPRRSMEYVLMTEGIIDKTSGARRIPSNVAAEEIEALVLEMKKQNRRMAIALRIQYFEKRKSRDRSEALGISATQFRVYVDMARQWLAGRLSARNNNFK
jgi:hypothetical protein